MQRILSLDQTPPFSVPLRFFLAAPIFAIIAAVLLFWQGPQALVSRWSPTTLALTHLLTLGFLTMSMIGAAIQILPVVAGIQIPRVHLNAAIVHALLTVGAITLSAGFVWSEPALFKLALPLLALAFGWLLSVICYGLWHSPGASAMLSSIRLAFIALLLTVIVGLVMASAFAWPLSLPLMQLADLHATWGLLGWVGLLVTGVAYQVVPMFQVTPLYPGIVTRWLPRSLFCFLVLWSALNLVWHGQPNAWMTAAVIVIVAAFVAFSLATMSLLWRKKRPKGDTTTLFWYTSLASLLACAMLLLFDLAMPHTIDATSYPLILGVLFIIGFGYSVVNGMLYKIIPFLVWYHLQSQLTSGCAKVPNVKKILPDSDTEMQFRAHLLALILLVGATLWPKPLTHLAATAFGISSCWLFWNLLYAARIYRRIVKSELKPALVAPMS